MSIYDKLQLFDIILLDNKDDIIKEVESLNFPFIKFRYRGEKRDHLAIYNSNNDPNFINEILGLLGKYELRSCHIIYRKGLMAEKKYINGLYKKTPTFLLGEYSNYVNKIASREIIIEE